MKISNLAFLHRNGDAIYGYAESKIYKFDLELHSQQIIDFPHEFEVSENQHKRYVIQVRGKFFGVYRNKLYEFVKMALQYVCDTPEIGDFGYIAYQQTMLIVDNNSRKLFYYANKTFQPVSETPLAQSRLSLIAFDDLKLLWRGGEFFNFDGAAEMKQILQLQYDFRIVGMTEYLLFIVRQDNEEFKMINFIDPTNVRIHSCKIQLDGVLRSLVRVHDQIVLNLSSNTLVIGHSSLIEKFFAGFDIIAYYTRLKNIKQTLLAKDQQLNGQQHFQLAMAQNIQVQSGMTEIQAIQGMLLKEASQSLQQLEMHNDLMKKQQETSFPQYIHLLESVKTINGLLKLRHNQEMQSMVALQRKEEYYQWLAQKSGAPLYTEQLSEKQIQTIVSEKQPETIQRVLKQESDSD